MLFASEGKVSTVVDLNVDGARILRLGRNSDAVVGAIAFSGRMMFKSVRWPVLE